MKKCSDWTFRIGRLEHLQTLKGEGFFHLLWDLGKDTVLGWVYVKCQGERLLGGTWLMVTGSCRYGDWGRQAPREDGLVTATGLRGLPANCHTCQVESHRTWIGNGYGPCLWRGKGCRSPKMIPVRSLTPVITQRSNKHLVTLSFSAKWQQSIGQCVTSVTSKHWLGKLEST